MGRSKVSTVKQPDEISCGPAALKTALRIFDKRVSISLLKNLCKTNSFGTSTPNMIHAIRTLGYCILYTENTSLNQLKRALYPKKQIITAIVVPYLYGGKHSNPKPESGHWATVASLGKKTKTITIFDSYEGKKKSYQWTDFKKRWLDYSLKRYSLPSKNSKPRTIWKYKKIWKKGIMIVMARTVEDLPEIHSASTHVFPALFSSSRNEIKPKQ